MTVDDELRFDGRVAVVTGAGRGIGRAHAIALAQRGAMVVVNDLGSEWDGSGPRDSTPADAVVAEILGFGGEAVADFGDISRGDDAQRLIDVALENFGRLDIVVNNAGILRVDDFPGLPVAEFQRLLDVHLIGSLNVIQAAWPTFAEQGYGRILNTVSAGLLGSAGNISYSSAKSGVWGLTRSLAQLGEKLGITVNAFSPSARSRLVGRPEVRRRAGLPSNAVTAHGEPEDIVPVAIYLVHEDVPVTGQVYSGAAGNVSRYFIGVTRGYNASDISPESVRDNWATINDETDCYVPAFAAELALLRGRTWADQEASAAKPQPMSGEEIR